MSATQTPNKPEAALPPLSRVGRRPVAIPDGVKVTVKDRTVEVEGKRGKLSWVLPPRFSAKVEDKQISVTPELRDRKSKALHGLSRKLVFNMVEGVTTGFRKRVVIEGVGFRSQIAGDKVTFSLGFSHPYVFRVPKGVTVKIEDPKMANVLTIEGNDKQQVGEVAAQIRSIKPPEPYKGTGIRYEDEVIKRKAGKAAVGAGGGKK